MIPYIVAVLIPIISSIRMVPQLYTTYTTKNVKGLSMIFLLLLLLSNVLWLLHGYFIFDYTLMVSAIISITINIPLIILFFYYKK